MPNVLGPGHQYIWLLFSNIWLLKFLNWLVMQLGTTKRPGLSLDIFNLQSEMMRS